MKVCWISHSADLGGAEFALLEAVRVLRERGVTFCAALPSTGHLATLLEKENVECFITPCTFWVARRWHRLPCFVVYRLLQNVLAWRQLTRWLVRHQPDIVVTNTLTIPAGAYAAHSAGIPHVWYAHEFMIEGLGLSFDLGQTYSLGLVNRLSAKVMTTSGVLLESLREWIPPTKLHVVYNAVEVPSLAPEPTIADNPLCLVVVGLKSPIKRQEDAIRAVALLKERSIATHLTLVGHEKPDYGLFLRKLTRSLNVESSVAFVPFTAAPYSLFASAHVALVCSRCEAFGRTTVEAMKLGKPVIGANRGGTLEIIADGHNGLLYEVGDPADLARKIERLYHDRTLLYTLGHNARAWATQTFTLERYSTDLLGVFQEVLRKQ